MPNARGFPSSSRPALVAAFTLVLAAGIGSLIQMTLEDFHVPGTQIGDVPQQAIWTSDSCSACHGGFGDGNDIPSTWKGSLMALSGKDPLFFAQMTNANQDAGEVGYYCLRCHVPLAIPSGHAVPSDGSALDDYDRDGVTCHFCHSMVDPIYKPGVSPPVDQAILAALDDVPQQYGNAMFVLDPAGTRRGPLRDAQPPHAWIYSPFHKTSELCGTCHDVGNVATTLQPDGTWRYNAIGVRADDPDPHAQFPLERTYTEWKLSAFANGGVDMGGKFGGEGVRMIESCQDCHMPRQTGRACAWGPERSIPRHEFAGASAPSLDLIGEMYSNDPNFDHAALRRGRQRSVEMLRRAATLRLEQDGAALRVRTTNDSGHKLPTGHIEGRRVWLNVRFYNADHSLAREYGRYDSGEAHIDEASTRIYEMEVGLSESASVLTGYPEGRTTHMALADTIVKDNRIPPRGFVNAAFEDGGAPVVGQVYADGQYWDDAWFTVPPGAAYVTATLNYQSLTRHYVEALRDGNVTDHWGRTLFSLWQATGRGAPIEMTSRFERVFPFLLGDVDNDCRVGRSDLAAIGAAWGQGWAEPGFVPRADLDGDHKIGMGDVVIVLAEIGRRCQ